MYRHHFLLILLLCLGFEGFGQSSFWTSTTTPQNASASDKAATTLGLKFNSAVPGKVTGIRFYKGSGNTGTHQGQVWSGNGTLLSSVTFKNESKSGWQVASFSTPVSISANTNYVVSYTAPYGGYAYNTYYSWPAPGESPLRVSGSTPGVYAYGSGARFPTESWNNSNYWVDVVFMADAVNPPKPSVTISVSPSSVTLNGGQTRQFSASVTGSSNTSVVWTVSPQVGTITASGIYSAPSVVSVAQTVTITARSVADSTKAATATVNLAAAQPPPGKEISFWNSQATPSAKQVNTTGKPVTVGLRFLSEVAGKVVGLRFYKRAENVGTHVGNLWTASGASLGQLTFTGETASGWQQANFSSPIAIKANTTYVASYFVPVGNYAEDTYYNWSLVNASPLRASGATPGVYAYGASTLFPANPWRTANYWVDILFLPDSGGVTPPPATYSISGTISGSSATVSLSGPSSGTTSTNASGNYTFSGLQNGLYAVVPSRTGYSFTPSSTAVTLQSASVSGINFAGKILPASRTVSLNWKASVTPSVAGYNVYRSTSAVGPYSKVNPSPVGGTSFADLSVTVGQTYFYQATTVGEDNTESARSNQATAVVN